MSDILHIYGQFTYHDEARIIGEREALVNLRNAIDAALRDGSAEATFMAKDGEGYGVKVERTNSVGMRATLSPYVAEWAAEHPQALNEELSWMAARLEGIASVFRRKAAA